jgi:UDP-N-acetylglucosamine 2-epimerase (non-hydrolysing)
LLTPSPDANATLRGEGEPEEEIVFVGNVMIDSLFHALPAARSTRFREQLGVADDAVGVTLHRPSNVDVDARLLSLVRSLRLIAEERPVLFPVHPRTRHRLSALRADLGQVKTFEPFSYLQMLDVVAGAHAVVTDSGGLQEETTALGVPCLTVRENTERPVTITEGTNQLVPDPDRIPALIRAARRPKVARRPEGWDGHAGERIIAALVARGPASSPFLDEINNRSAAVLA